MSHKTVFLLDAYALIFRAYYAFIRAPRRDSKGRDVSAVFGFALSLQDLIDKYAPDYLAVAFDPPGGTFRHREYPEYKAQRDATPEGIITAVPLIKQLLEAYKIPIIEIPDYEADDVIGTLAVQAEKEGYRVMMVTPDKDYAQLVTPSRIILRPANGGGYEEMGVDEVRHKFGLQSPEQMIDYLGLVGDSADNIPGCKGIGPKGAEKLLSEYGTIDNLLVHAEEIAGANGKKIREHVEEIRMSRYLAKICTHVPVQFDAELYRRETPDAAAIQSLFEELQFRTLLKRVLSDAGNTIMQTGDAEPIMDDLFAPQISVSQLSNQTASEASAATLIPTSLHSLADTPHEYRLVETETERRWLADRLLRAHVVAFDTETTHVDALKAELVAISFAIDPHEAYCMPLDAQRNECMRQLDPFRAVLESPDILKVGQNIKYDMQVLFQYGMEVQAPMFDTMLAHYLLWPDRRHNMDLMAEQLLGYRTMTFETLTAGLPLLPNQSPNLRAADPRTLCDYAAEDADVTLQMYLHMEPMLRQDNLMELMMQVEMPLVPVLCSMERGGVRLDTRILSRIENDLEQELVHLENEIYRLAEKTFNINSSRQVGEILFDNLKIAEKPRKTKNGSYSTSEEVLEQLAGAHPIVPLILDYRGTKKLLSTYLQPMPDMLYPDGRLHGSFNQAVAATGRLSGSNPNLQNIPIRTEQGRRIREAFVPDNADCLFLSADYSQIELRLMAHLSQDEEMIADFMAGHDIHAATAAKIFHVPLNEVTAEMRRQAKTANFGIIYGISAFGLAQRLTISRTQAAELIKGYFATYPGVKAYMDKAIEEGRERGYVTTLMGRRRYLDGIRSANSVVRGNAERNAINAPIQGTAADIIKMAMNRIYHRMRQDGMKSRLILQVHDELNFNVLPEELEQMKVIVRSGMEDALPGLRVPLIAEIGVGKNWLEAH